MMRVSNTELGIFTIGAAVLGTVIVTSMTTKHIIRGKCRKQVKKACKDVPLLTDEFCDEQAEKICDV